VKSFSKYIKEQKSSEVTKNWRFEDARMYADKMVKVFGEPDEMTETRLSWNSIEPPFNEVWVIDESIPHDFPAPHRDYVYSTMKMKVPTEMLDILGHASGSIIYDGLKMEVTARCGSLYANAATLGFVKDLVDGKIKVNKEQAKKEYAARIKSKPLPDWYPNSMEE
tara:strand:+ start:155 stop:652 length:498 start_codon:yes stop_codon:yes gene_type:complete